MLLLSLFSPVPLFSTEYLSIPSLLHIFFLFFFLFASCQSKLFSNCCISFAFRGSHSFNPSYVSYSLFDEGSLSLPPVFLDLEAFIVPLGRPVEITSVRFFNTPPPLNKFSLLLSSICIPSKLFLVPRLTYSFRDAFPSFHIAAQHSAGLLSTGHPPSFFCDPLPL